MSITEGTQPAAKTWTGAWTTAQTTASFTPEAGALLVALVSGDGSAGATTASVTDSLSGTWTLLKRQNTQVGTTTGTAEVWCRDSPNASMTVSVTGTASTGPGGQLVVRTLIGALPTASQNGATAGATPQSAAIQVSVAAGTGNKIYGAAFDFVASPAMTLLGNTSDVANFVDATNGDNWAAFKSTGDTAGTATYGYSTAHDGMIAAVEIKAAAVGGGGQPAQPGQTWRRRFRRRQTPWPTTPPAAAPVSTVASWLRQRRGSNSGQGQSSYWQPAPTGQTNAPRASWIQGRARTTVNKAGRYWAPVPTGQRNAPVVSWIRQRRQSTATGRGRFWGAPPPPPVTVPSGVASFMRQRVGKVNQARGRFWAPRTAGQPNIPVASYYKGRARPTVNKAGRYWAPVPTGATNAPVSSYYHGRARVIVNKAGRYWQPVPIPPATIARTVASWIRQRTGIVPQGRGRFWYPRSAGQANIPRASWMRQTPRPVPPVRRGQFWVAPPTKPVPQAAPPSFLSRGLRPTSRPRYGGRFWSRLYPAAATTVSKPVASFLRQRRGRTVSDRGRWWPIVAPPPVITVIPPVTVTSSTSPTVTVTGSTAGTVTSSGSSAASTSASGSTAPATTATGTTGPTVPTR